MRKILCTTAIIISLFFTVYSGLWFYTTGKIKNTLQKISSSAKFYEIEFTYDNIITYGFPFSAKLDIKNPKIVIHNAQPIFAKSDSLLLKYKPLSKWLSLSIPSNTINVTASDDQENYSIVCNAHELAFISKLNKPLFLLKIKNESSVVDYVNLLRYEDHGLNCTALSGNDEIQTNTRFSQGNHLQLAFDRESDEHIKLSVNSHISKYIEAKDQISNIHPEVNANFDVEVLSNKSSVKLNLDIEKFSISGNDFAINVRGKLHDFIFTALSYSFKDEIRIDMLNYKECISFLIDQYSPSSNTQIIDNIQELIFNIAQKINDNDIRTTLSYNNEAKVAYIGNMQFDTFINKIRELYDNKGKIEENVGKKNIDKYENANN